MPISELTVSRASLIDDQRYSPGQVAGLFGCSRQTVAARCRAGLIPARRLIGGRHWRILGADVRRILDAEAGAVVSPTGTRAMRDKMAMAGIVAITGT